MRVDTVGRWESAELFDRFVLGPVAILLGTFAPLQNNHSGKSTGLGVLSQNNHPTVGQLDTIAPFQIDRLNLNESSLGHSLLYRLRPLGDGVEALEGFALYRIDIAREPTITFQTEPCQFHQGRK